MQACSADGRADSHIDRTSARALEQDAVYVVEYG
jgi:hypothetical protein